MSKHDVFPYRLADNLEAMAGERGQRFSDSPLLLNAASELRRLEALSNAQEQALSALVEMRDTHYEVYGYEKQHYIIDENPQWKQARSLIEPKP